MTTHDEYLLDGERTPELLEELARDCGCMAIFATEYEIQVDLDSTSLDRFHASYELLKKNGFLLGSTAQAWHSKGGNWHVVVSLLPTMETTAQQRGMFALMLGSDPTREILNMVERRAGAGTIVLFMPIGAIIFSVNGRNPSDKRGRRKAEREMEAYL